MLPVLCLWSQGELYLPCIQRLFWAPQRPCKSVCCLCEAQDDLFSWKNCNFQFPEQTRSDFLFCLIRHSEARESTTRRSTAPLSSRGLGVDSDWQHVSWTVTYAARHWLERCKAMFICTETARIGSITIRRHHMDFEQHSFAWTVLCVQFAQSCDSHPLAQFSQWMNRNL